MRYVTVPAVSFTDINGVTRPVKLIRTIPTQDLAFTLEVGVGDQLDEIASRDHVYGSGGESQAHKIFDFNITQLVDARFDLSRIRRLGIPRQ